MKHIKIVIATALLFGIYTIANAGVFSNERFDEPFSAFVPCADDGNGEWIEGTISFHLVLRENFDAADGYHFGGMIHPVRTVLTGVTTGDEYIATGSTQERKNVRFGDLPLAWTFTNHEVTIGKGKASNMTLSETIHLTINSQGEATAEVENVWFTCK
jgi:hypothetical protein